MNKSKVTLESLFNEIQILKTMIASNNVNQVPKIPKSTERYVSPKEVLQRLNISRSKLECWIQSDFLNRIKPEENGKKIYFLNSELDQKFPSVFPLDI